MATKIPEFNIPSNDINQSNNEEYIEEYFSQIQQPIDLETEKKPLSSRKIAQSEYNFKILKNTTGLIFSISIGVLISKILYLPALFSTVIIIALATIFLSLEEVKAIIDYKYIEYCAHYLAHILNNQTRKLNQKDKNLQSICEQKVLQIIKKGTNCQEAQAKQITSILWYSEYKNYKIKIQKNTQNKLLNAIKFFIPIDLFNKCTSSTKILIMIGVCVGFLSAIITVPYSHMIFTLESSRQAYELVTLCLYNMTLFPTLLCALKELIHRIFICSYEQYQQAFTLNKLAQNRNQNHLCITQKIIETDLN